MNDEKKQDIAIMRYTAIAPLVAGLSENYPSMQAFFREVSAKGIKHPDGTIKHYAPKTIEKWYRTYMLNGFDSLLPSSRFDLGKPRKLDEDLRKQIEYLKNNYPRITATAIYKQLQDNGSIKKGELSLSTVNRYVNILSAKNMTTNNTDMRRYERPHINEVWCGDTTYGPYIKTANGRKQRIYIMALIDDASRFIVGIDIFFNDNFINLMSVIKSAVSKYGRPKIYNFDNGSSFKNKQMELLAARTGSVVHYNQPYTPTQKAKIERWFGTLKSQWLSTLNINDFNSVDELRESLFIYVQKYNQSVHSSLNGLSPQDRFFSEPECVKRLDDYEIEHSFLLEIERRVTADCIIVINQVEYEVDYRFAKQRIRLRYSPDFEKIYIVESDSILTPIKLLNKTDNAVVKREKIHLSRGE